MAANCNINDVSIYWEIRQNNKNSKVLFRHYLDIRLAAKGGVGAQCSAPLETCWQV